MFRSAREWPVTHTGACKHIIRDRGQIFGSRASARGGGRAQRDSLSADVVMLGRQDAASRLGHWEPLQCWVPFRASRLGSYTNSCAHLMIFYRQIIVFVEFLSNR